MSKAVFEYVTDLLKDGIVRIKKGFCAKDKTNTPNWHEHIEILFCVQGCGVVQLDDRKYSFKKGNFIIVNSQVIHSITGISDLEFYYVHIDSNFCVANEIDPSVVTYSEFINEDIELKKLLDLLASTTVEQGRFSKTKINKAVLELLIYISEKYALENSEKALADKVFERVKSVMLYLKQNLDKELTLEEIAKMAGINKYQLTREFKAVTGESVFEFLNSVRCKEASRLLKQGASVTQAAYSCGFSNLSYFTRTYKKYIGELPSARKAYNK